jgi:long-chain acyl-CoA synthetase
MDVTPYLTIRPAPCAVLDRVPARANDVRFRVRGPDGAWGVVTWGEFAAQIRAVAAWLIRAGIQPGDRCAVYAHNSVAWGAAALGIQAAGAVMVPIYPASTAEQVAYVVGHAGVRALFVGGGELRARISGLPVEHVVDLVCDWATICATPDDGAPDRSAVDARVAAIDLDAPGLLLYTSGTSGNPKGVPLTHRNVGVNAGDWLRCNAPLLETGYRDLLWLPMSHIFGFGELCLGNTLEWETWMASPADALQVLPDVAPEVFFSVPAYWEKLARGVLAEAGEWGDREARRRALVRQSGGRLRFCLSGGAGLKVEIKELLKDCGLLVIEGYGLTETSPTLTLNRPDAYRFDTVGKPLPSVELRLDDDGEILARGPNVFGGYFQDPEATRAAFTDDGWFRTGDVGRWTDDGFLQIVDRKKDILVTAGGKNVPPANIEARFADDPVIERCVVYGDARPYLVAALWVRAGASETEIAARVDAANAGLARFETIKKWFVCAEPLTVEGGTLTSSLKLRRKAVYTRYRERFEALYA